MTRGNGAAVERVEREPVEREPVEREPVEREPVEREESEWVRAHRALSRLAQQRARADAEEGPWLLAALRSAAHVHAGFGSFGEYIGHLFGYSPRFTHDKLRVAEALENLPVLARALESGALHWSALRELTRVATTDTEREWLDVARGKNVRQLEALVAGASPGDLPSDRREPGLARHVLRFEVTADTFAIFREAMSHLRRASDVRLDDDASLLTMARAVLGGPCDEGRSSYQIALSVCSECDRGAQPAAGETVRVAPEIVAMAWCDAQNLGHITTPANQNDAIVPDLDEDVARNLGADPTGPTPSLQRRTQTGSSPREAQAPGNTTERLPSHAQTNGASIAVAHGRCAQMGKSSLASANDASIGGTHGSCNHVGPSFVASANDASIAVAHGSCAQVGKSCAASTNDPSIAGSPGSCAHVGTSARAANVRHPTPAGARARQTIPPAVRRAVLHRDHHHCRVPGCRNATFLDVHHIRPRCEGGRNVAGNLLTLCGVHHRAAHRGALVVEGVSAESVGFRHADGSPYGNPADVQVLDAHAKVFSALRHLGFRESEVRGVMEVLRQEVEARSLGTQQLLRKALERLGPPTRGR